jgi:hypothetical protein
MKTNILSGFAFLCWWWLNRLGLNLAYHEDPQGMPHLAVIRHDPTKKQQFGAFLYPGEQYDLYDPCPDISEEYFTLINTENLWKKVNFKFRWFKFDFDFAKHLLAAISRLKEAEKARQE